MLGRRVLLRPPRAGLDSETRAWVQTLPPAQGPGSSVEDGQSWLRPVGTCNGAGEVRLKFRGQTSLRPAAQMLALRPGVGGLAGQGGGSRSAVPMTSGPAPGAGLWAAAAPSLASPVGRAVSPARCQVSLKCTFPQWTDTSGPTHLHPTAPVPSRGPQGPGHPESRILRGPGPLDRRTASCRLEPTGQQEARWPGADVLWAGGLTWLGQPEA